MPVSLITKNVFQKVLFRIRFQKHLFLGFCVAYTQRVVFQAIGEAFSTWL